MGEPTSRGELPTRALAVVRHGEAESIAPGGPDAQRALTERGRQEARAAGRRLRELWGEVDLVLHSPAVRTTQTWQAMAAELPALAPAQVWPAPGIYEAAVPDLLAALADVPEESRRVLVVGHAPGVPALVGHLTGEYPQGWPTGTLGVMELPQDLGWADLHEGCGRRTG